MAAATPWIYQAALPVAYDWLVVSTQWTQVCGLFLRSLMLGRQRSAAGIEGNEVSTPFRLGGGLRKGSVVRHIFWCLEEHYLLGKTHVLANLGFQVRDDKAALSVCTRNVRQG